MLVTNPNIHTLTKNLKKAISAPEIAKNSKDRSDLVTSLSLAIKKLQDDLRQKTKNATTVSTYLGELTWVETKDEEVKESIAALLESSQTWYNLELEYIEAIQPIIKSGIAAKEFKAYNEAIEDLDEAISDLKSAAITLPASKEFNDAMNELANL